MSQLRKYIYNNIESKSICWPDTKIAIIKKLDIAMRIFYTKTRNYHYQPIFLWNFPKIHILHSFSVPNLAFVLVYLHSWWVDSKSVLRRRVSKIIPTFLTDGLIFCLLDMGRKLRGNFECLWVEVLELETSNKNTKRI